jgi:hypothetical protein
MADSLLPQPGREPAPGNERDEQDLEFGGPDTSGPAQPYQKDPTDTLSLRGDWGNRVGSLYAAGDLPVAGGVLVTLAVVWAWSGNTVLGVTSMAFFTLHLGLLRLARYFSERVVVNRPSDQDRLQSDRTGDDP